MRGIRHIPELLVAVQEAAVISEPGLRNPGPFRQHVLRGNAILLVKEYLVVRDVLRWILRVRPHSRIGYGEITLEHDNVAFGSEVVVPALAVLGGAESSDLVVDRARCRQDRFVRRRQLVEYDLRLREGQRSQDLVAYRLG